MHNGEVKMSKIFGACFLCVCVYAPKREFKRQQRNKRTKSVSRVCVCVSMEMASDKPGAKCNGASWPDNNCIQSNFLFEEVIFLF